MNHIKAVEDALANGHIWALMTNGRYWKLRRNGQTKLWKTRPDDFRIPVKCGLKSCGYLTQDSPIGLTIATHPDFLVSSTDPNVKEKKSA
jgi:hypothetical protein